MHGARLENGPPPEAGAGAAYLPASRARIISMGICTISNTFQIGYNLISNRAISDEGGKIMNAKHTPGPWETDGTVVRAMGNDDFEVDLTENSTPFPTTDANARLIAAAPELLNACVRMMVGITKRDSHNCEWYEGIEVDGAEEARAAIAKAEGEQ